MSVMLKYVCLGVIIALVVIGLVDCNSNKSVSPGGPEIHLSKTSLVYSAIAGSANPPAQRVTVTNTGTGHLTFTVTKKAQWINILPNTDSIIYVEVFTTGLATGEHFDTLVVSSPEAVNSPRRIAVKLVLGQGFTVSPGSFVFTALRNGDNPPPQKLTITNAGGGALTYSIAKEGSWVTLSKTSGSATDSLDVGVASSTLASGVYGGRLTITSAQSAHQSIVSCSLMVSSWDRQELSQSYALRDIDWTDQQHGWITGFIGNNPGHVGVILYSDDGGGAWRQQHLENNTNMGGIDMIDDTTGWAVGDSAVLLRLTNDSVWTRYTDIPVTDSVNLWRVHFVSSTRGWIAGTHGTILHTNDGGTTWTKQTSGVDVSLANIYFVDENEGWIVGNNGKILHTTLAGHDWAVQPSGTLTDLWGIYFSDRNNGWIVGWQGELLRTINGGANWAMSKPGADSAQYQQIVFTDDALHGWIVGHHGTILYTTDGGGTWRPQLTGVDNWLFDVVFFDKDKGFAIGEKGLILRTVGGGF